MSYVSRRPWRITAEVAAILALSAALGLSSLPRADAATASRPATCPITAPVFQNIPVLGDRFGDISEWNFSYCRRVDTVRVLTDQPVDDRDGQAWYRASLDGPTYGRRVGWVPADSLEWLDLRPGAVVSASRDDG